MQQRTLCVHTLLYWYLCTAYISTCTHICTTDTDLYTC